MSTPEELLSGPIELRVLDELAAGSATPAQIAARLGVPESALAPCFEWAVSAGTTVRLDLPSGATYSLTADGLHLVTERRALATMARPGGQVDLSAVSDYLVRRQYAAQDGRLARAEEEQAGLPADDVWRDWGIQALTAAFAEGRLTTDQLDLRSTSVLTATTMGELRTALEGVAEVPLVPGRPLPAAPDLSPRAVTPFRAAPTPGAMLLLLGIPAVFVLVGIVAGSFAITAAAGFLLMVFGIGVYTAGAR